MTQQFQVRPPSLRERLETVEKTLKQLIDYVVALNLLCQEKGLFSQEEHDRIGLDVSKGRKVMQDLDHFSGLKVIRLSRSLDDIGKGKSKGGEGG